MSFDPRESFRLPESLEPMVLMSASAAELTASELTQGTAGNDVMISLTPDELLAGGSGHDIMIALGGNNVLRGDAGHDTLISVRGDNVLDGGAGIDTAVYWNGNRADFKVTDHGFGILELAGSKNSDFLTNIEQVQFQDGVYSIDELLTGAAKAPALGIESQDSAQQTIDSLKTPTDGNDVLVANLPGESIDAKGGNDIVVGLGNGNAISGSTGNDAIYSAGGSNLIDGGAGDDTVIYGGIKNDYQLASEQGGAISVSSSTGSDVLINIETISFKDATVDVGSLNLPPVMPLPPTTEVPVVEVPVVEVPVVEVPVVEVPVVEVPVVEVPVVEVPVVEVPVVEVPVVEVPVVEVPVVDTTPVDSGSLTFTLPVAGDLYSTVATGSGATYELVQAPSVGSVNFYPNGSFDYHAPVGFEGNVTFQYRIVAADGSVETATLVMKSGSSDPTPIPSTPVVETPVVETPVTQPTDEVVVEEVDTDSAGLQLNPSNGINLIDTSAKGSVTVTFQSESAGYQNTLGTYLINKTTGAISDVKILFANASQAGSGGSLVGGTSQATVQGKDGYSVGFFLLADGNKLNNLSSITNSTLALESSANGGLTLTALTNGSSVSLNGSLYISSHPGLNADGKDHFRFSQSGDSLRISVEDLPNLGDNDFNDVIVLASVGKPVVVIEPVDPGADTVEVIELDTPAPVADAPKPPAEPDTVEVIELNETPAPQAQAPATSSYNGGLFSWVGSFWSGILGGWW